MKTLQTERGRLALTVLFNMLVVGLISITDKTVETKFLRNSASVQISQYFFPETPTPAGSGPTLCACIQGVSRQA